MGRVCTTLLFIPAVAQSSLGFAAARGAQCGISEQVAALRLRTQPVALNSEDFF